jgi:hypothetical protein
MVVSASGNLGKVRYRQHLAIFAQLFHETTHGFSDSAAHAGVNLVRNKCLSGTQLAGGDRNGQGDARKFAT